MDTHSTTLTWFDLAERTGISVRSLRAIHYRSARNRRLAHESGDSTRIKTGDLPEPDGYHPADGRPGRPRPYWTDETLGPWLAHKNLAPAA